MHLFKIILFPFIIILAACTNKHASTSETTMLMEPRESLLLKSSYAMQTMLGDFAENPIAKQFVDSMVKKHGFNRQQLHAVISQAKRLNYVLRLMDRQALTYKSPARPNGAWLRYCRQFITPRNVKSGVVFWDQNQDYLMRAQHIYGVPPGIIVGIIGVETGWGRIMGQTPVLDALTTLAFNYPRRASYFSNELENFLLMARNEKNNLLDMRGSFAGAMGYGQFMPSSYQQYAIDFNGDGHINLWDPVDTIGSIAHFFKEHGWRRGEGVAIPASSGQIPFLQNGCKTGYKMQILAATTSSLKGSLLDGSPKVSLLSLNTGTSYEYWYGLHNFYVIMRYNHSIYYAIAVWQLGEAISKARMGFIF
ncbi:lytic murein transglycosylase B [Pantoea sp. Nvir]|uniref:lytic murein transglycosylase B n=1 Tax=Pantoea sp. Nvir TaxID=2576760 RepID=UPI001358D09E|nr:lytic murein transglycosylase B [Pantoea sp. Nvir]MXP66722.1 lytic murein transglycosylase B [Pantoea sp. Nvir]CAJ0991027.1 Membrane-bound lytic murein transglycosylase B [Pantoea sp. Nvir]